MSTYIRVALLVVVSLMAAGGAQAAPAAKEKEASRLFFGGRFGEALAIYVDLAVETSNPIYMCEIGRCHQRLGNLVEARRNVSECLAAAKLTPAKKRQFQAVLAEIDAAAARAPVAASGATTAPAPPGAPVSDPLAPPATGAPPATPPPAAASVAEAPPPAPAPPAAPPAPTQPGWNPGPYGQYGAPPAHLQQATGGAPSGGGTWKRPTAYVAGAIGLLGVGAGVYSGLTAKKKFDQVVRIYDDQAYKQGKKFNTYQMIGYGVGAAGLGTAVVLLLTSSGAGEPRAAAAPAASDHRLSLMVGHDGLALAGSF